MITEKELRYAINTHTDKPIKRILTNIGTIRHNTGCFLLMLKSDFIAAHLRITKQNCFFDQSVITLAFCAVMPAHHPHDTNERLLK